MEKWKFHRYERPYLAVDSIDIDEEAGTVNVVSSGEAFEVSVAEGDVDADSVVKSLQQLRDPDSALWGALRHLGEGSANWIGLVQQMDELSLIEDFRENAAEVSLSNGLDEILQLAESLPGRMTERAESGEALRNSMALLEPYLSRLVREVVEETDAPVELDRVEWSPLPSPFDATDNFYLRTILWQLRYWRSAAPVTLLSIWHSLQIASGNGDTSRDLFRRIASHIWCGLYSLRDTRQEMHGFVQLMVWSTGSNARVMAMYQFTPQHELSSSSFVVHAERVTNEILNHFGEPRYLTALRSGAAGKALIAGCYVEEYHVTTRFVEIITPTLSKRLSEPLRSRLFQYYAEEVGHEVFERETCEALGISGETLSRISPLPLHAAFVDTFTHFASVDPLGYFLSIFVTEGMLGVDSPIGVALEAMSDVTVQFQRVSGRHDLLNEQLNHSSLSRLIMADVQMLPTSCQSRAIASLAHLLELNFRAWERLYDYYSPMASIEELCRVAE